ncbi:hypothetical protein [Pseudomonas nitroreducens]|uniref:hypothetical protein n=1 Tax=Pseudomonas nitroreducens TaxID=46680 RepID=UPI00351D50B1
MELPATTGGSEAQPNGGWSTTTSAEQVPLPENMYSTGSDIDKWSRTPKSLQDQMALDAAKSGQGVVIIKDLNDPRFKGMEKIELKIKSANGNDSVVHYVRNPETGELMDFKFKKHSIDNVRPWGNDPSVPPGEPYESNLQNK